MERRKKIITDEWKKKKLAKRTTREKRAADKEKRWVSLHVQRAEKMTTATTAKLTL